MVHFSKSYRGGGVCGDGGAGSGVVCIGSGGGVQKCRSEGAGKKEEEEVRDPYASWLSVPAAHYDPLAERFPSV